MKRLIALAVGLYLAVMWVEVAGQTARPLPGDPLPGITSGEFEEFRLGLEDFTEVETVEDGLGPAFNGSSCAVCHSVPAIGGAGVVAEVRAARRDEHGEFVELAPTSGSLFQIFSIPPHTCQPIIPPEANVISRRVPIPLFGAGPRRSDRGRNAARARRRRRPRPRRHQRARRGHHRHRHRPAPRRPVRVEGAAGDAAWRSGPTPTGTRWGLPTTSFRRSSRSASRASR